MSIFSIPIFPLPEIILFPGTFLPLHIFEPRYKEMLEYSINSHHLMAIASYKVSGETDEDPLIEEIFGWGKIVRKESLHDGRSNIILQGNGIVKLLKYTKMKPFRIGEVESVALDNSFRRNPDFRIILDEMIHLTKRILLSGGAGEDFIEKLGNLTGHDYPADFIASLINFDFKDKYDLFTTADYIEKSKKMLDILRKINLSE